MRTFSGLRSLRIGEPLKNHEDLKNTVSVEGESPHIYLSHTHFGMLLDLTAGIEHVMLTGG